MNTHPEPRFTYQQPHTRRPDYRGLLFLIAAIALAFDQFTKAIIIDWLAIGESWRPWPSTPILELFAFTHTKNTGAAFGMLQEGGIFFVIVAVLVSIFIALYGPRVPRHRWWTFIALGLILGGSLGNLYDRLRIGHVTDFVHVGTFAIFNVADSAIFIGTIFLMFIMFREDTQLRQQSQNQPQSPPPTPRQVDLNAEFSESEGV